MEPLTKILLLFFNFYQRLNSIWTIFEKLARKFDDFDILKQFGNFRDSMLQTLIVGESYQGMPEPEMLYNDILGDLGPIVANLPGLISRILKRILTLTNDYSIRELLNIQLEADFTMAQGAKFMETKFSNIVGGPGFFQLSSFDRRLKKFYIHHIRLESKAKAAEPETGSGSKVQEETALQV